MRCAVFGCGMDNQKKYFDRNIQFFRFPKDKEKQIEWIRSCTRKEKFNVVNARICSKHFNADDYVRNLKHELLGYPPGNRWRALKKEAVPSNHLPLPRRDKQDSGRECHQDQSRDGQFVEGFVEGFKEYSPLQEQALVKIEPNSFEDIEEVDINEYMIQNEDLSRKDLEGSEVRCEEEISAQKGTVVKVEINEEREMDEITFKECKIKNEEIDIKEELEECETVGISPQCVDQDNKCEERRTPKESDQIDEETSLKRRLLTKFLKSERCSDKTIQVINLKGPNFQQKYLKGKKDDLLEYIKRSYPTGCKMVLKKHVKPEVEPQEDVEMFTCDKCDFQTKYKYNLKTHRLKHNKSEDVKQFKCHQCSYRTILKGRLNRHLIQHMNPEKIAMFKCNKCDFQSKYKNSLKTHRLKHNSSEEVNMFKCDQCSYETVYKINLRRHLPQHTNPEQMFKCKKCDFQTKNKFDLKTHVIQHNNSDDVKKFKCDQCSYQTIYRESLKKHLLRHMKPDQVEMFKCDHCNFKTIHKRSVKLHLLRHNNSKL